MALRRRWWQQAAAHHRASPRRPGSLLQKRISQSLVSSCSAAFHRVSDSSGMRSLWRDLQHEAGLPDSFVLLPATSAIGSYKNPELLAQALADRALLSLPLVLCGIGAEQRAEELELHFLTCVGVLAVSLAILNWRWFTADSCRCHSSRIEGFGLPAIEVMASGGLSLLADARGHVKLGRGGPSVFSAPS